MKAKRDLFSFVGFATPISFGRLCLLASGIVTLSLLGRSGSAAVAAFFIPFAMQNVLIVLATAVMRGIETATARARSADRALGPILKVAMAMTVVVGILSALALFFVPQLMQLSGSSPELVDHAREVVRKLVPGMPAMAILIACTFLLEANKRQNYVTVTSVILLVSNVIACLVLLPPYDRPPASVAADAAMAVTISRLVGAVVIFAIFVRVFSSHLNAGEIAPRPLKREGISLVRQIGVSATLTEVAGAAGMAMIALMVSWAGPNVVHAYQIALNLLAIGMTIIASIATASGIRAAYSHVQGHLPDVVNTVLISAVLVLCIAGVSAFVGLYVPHAWISFFSQDDSTSDLAVLYLLFVPAILIASGFANVQIAVLRAMKDVWFGQIAKASAVWLCAVPIVFVSTGEATLPGLLLQAVLLLAVTSWRLIVVFRKDQKQLDVDFASKVSG